MEAKKTLLRQRRVRVANAKLNEKAALAKLQKIDDNIEKLKIKYECCSNAAFSSLFLDLVEVGHEYNVAKEAADELTRKRMSEESELAIIQSTLLPSKPHCGGKCHVRHATGRQGGIPKTAK